MTVLPLAELELLRRWRNHGEYRRVLEELLLTTDLPAFDCYVEHITRCWFALAREHLAEAEKAEVAALRRTVYSRSYYAAYNGSKAVRFLVSGEVSLKADDHKRAADLPDDFPDVGHWGSEINVLYEHRLRADYDNWGSTKADLARASTAVLESARKFLNIASEYVEKRKGWRL